MANVLSRWATRRRQKKHIYNMFWLSMATLVVLEYGTFVLVLAYAGGVRLRPLQDHPLRRKLRVISSALITLWITLMIGNLCFIFLSCTSNRPKRRLVLSVLFSVMEIILAGIGLGVILSTGFDTMYDQFKWSSSRSLSRLAMIYLPPSIITIGMLLKAVIVSLEAWWLPKALQTPFHHEPTVDVRKVERLGRGSRSTREASRSTSQSITQGPLEDMFAKHAAMESSIHPISSEQPVKVGSSSSNIRDCKGPQLHTSIRYWYGRQYRITTANLLLKIVFYPFIVYAAVELIMFSVKFHTINPQPWFSTIELFYPLLVLFAFGVAMVLISYRMPLGCGKKGCPSIEHLLYCMIISGLTLGVTASWADFVIRQDPKQGPKHWDTWPRYIIAFPISMMAVAIWSALIMTLLRAITARLSRIRQAQVASN